MNCFANNLRELRKFLASTGINITQEKSAELIGIKLSTYGRWENDKEHTDSSYVKVVGWINKYFEKHKVKVTVEDLLAPGLVEKIRKQIREDLDGPDDRERYSRKHMNDFLRDLGLCRLLEVDEETKGWMESILKIVREDLDKEDWIDLVKTYKAGRWEEDGWMFKDPKVVGQRVRFKATRMLTRAELAKVSKIVESVVEELQREEKKKRGNNEAS